MTDAPSTAATVAAVGSIVSSMDAGATRKPLLPCRIQAQVVSAAAQSVCPSRRQTWHPWETRRGGHMLRGAALPPGSCVVQEAWHHVGAACITPP